MSEAAVIAWAVFFVVCVAWRFWYQRRLTSESGLRALASGRVDSIGWWGGTAIVVSFSTLFIVPTLETAGLIERTTAPPWQVGAGVVVMAAGIVVTSAAQVGMGTSWRVGVRSGERTALITHGIFGIVRNPIFCGVIASAIGAAVLVPRPAMFAAVLGAILGVELQVRLVEEPHLREIHGADYAEYTARVGRFVPGIGKRT